MQFLGARTSRYPWLCRKYRLTGVAAFSSSTPAHAKRSEYDPVDKWNYNTSPLYGPTDTDISDFKYVTANDLEQETKLPRRVKMLARDFIEDSLYNPNYGYFSKEATIFETKTAPFNFPILRDSAEFSSQVGQRYAEYAHNTQLWHTPTELFKVRAQKSQ